jgi:hypothetical protein
LLKPHKIYFALDREVSVLIDNRSGKIDYFESSLLPLVTPDAVEAAITRARESQATLVAATSVVKTRTLTTLQRQDEVRRIEREKRHLEVVAKKAKDVVERDEAEQLRMASGVLFEVSALSALVEARLETERRLILDEQTDLKARNFHHSRLLRRTFDVFLLMRTLRKRRTIKADRYYKEKTAVAILSKWQEQVKTSKGLYAIAASRSDAKVKRITFLRLKEGVKNQRIIDAELTAKIHGLRQLHVIDRWVVSSAKNLARKASMRYRLEAEVESRFRRHVLQRAFDSWANALGDMKEEREARIRQDIIVKRALEMLNEDFNEQT